MTTCVVTISCIRPPGPGKVGDRLEYQGYAMTVINVERAEDFPGARRARQGDVLVAVEILVESQSAAVKVSPAHMWLADPGGKAYKPHKTGRGPVLDEREQLAKGERVQGWLTFEVPSEQKALRFVNELPQAFKHAELKVNLN
jgi:hypothetical protein